MKELKDIMPLIPTPFKDNGDVDESSLKSLIDFEMENGSYGVGVLAAIGEGYLISHEGWKEVIKITVKHMNAAGPVMAGCATMGTYHAMQLCREAEELGADAILGFNPTGFRTYKVSELINHWVALTEAVKIHIAPYARELDPIPFEVISELVKKNKIAYMKYAWKSCELLKQMIESFGDKFYIFCGADTFTLRYLELGCKGVLTATAAMLPREHVTLLSMVRGGDIEGAVEYYNQTILSWNDIGFSDMSTWQAVHKVALQQMGIIKSAKVLLPQGPPTPLQVEEVKRFVRRLGKKK
jgi:4-hydroxy-tetrahydrodipicolinate synthase